MHQVGKLFHISTENLFAELFGPSPATTEPLREQTYWLKFTTETTDLVITVLTTVTFIIHSPKSSCQVERKRKHVMLASSQYRTGGTASNTMSGSVGRRSMNRHDAPLNFLQSDLRKSVKRSS